MKHPRSMGRKASKIQTEVIGMTRGVHMTNGNVSYNTPKTQYVTNEKVIQRFWGRILSKEGKMMCDGDNAVVNVISNGKETSTSYEGFIEMLDGFAPVKLGGKVRKYPYYEARGTGHSYGGDLWCTITLGFQQTPTRQLLRSALLHLASSKEEHYDFVEEIWSFTEGLEDLYKMVKTDTSKDFKLPSCEIEIQESDDPDDMHENNFHTDSYDDVGMGVEETLDEIGVGENELDQNDDNTSSETAQVCLYFCSIVNSSRSTQVIRMIHARATIVRLVLDVMLFWYEWQKKWQIFIVQH